MKKKREWTPQKDYCKNYLKDTKAHKRYAKDIGIEDFKADKKFLMGQIQSLANDKISGWWNDTKESQLQSCYERLNHINEIWKLNNPKKVPKQNVLEMKLPIALREVANG